MLESLFCISRKLIFIWFNRLSILNFLLYITQELELQQSKQIGKESYEESIMWPNINCPPNIIGMSPYYGLPNMLQGGNSPFQSSMIRQVVGMQPFSYHENTSQACIYLLCYSYVFLIFFFFLFSFRVNCLSIYT